MYLHVQYVKCMYTCVHEYSMQTVFGIILFTRNISLIVPYCYISNCPFLYCIAVAVAVF